MSARRGLIILHNVIWRLGDIDNNFNSSATLEDYCYMILYRLHIRLVIVILNPETILKDGTLDWEYEVPPINDSGSITIAE